MEIDKKPIGGGIDENGHYRCFFCDGIVQHTGSDMAVDVYPDCDEEDVLHYMQCSHCKAEYEIIQHQGETTNTMQEELRLRKEYLK